MIKVWTRKYRNDWRR